MLFCHRHHHPDGCLWISIVDLLRIDFYIRYLSHEAQTNIPHNNGRQRFYVHATLYL